MASQRLRGGAVILLLVVLGCGQAQGEDSFGATMLRGAHVNDVPRVLDSFGDVGEYTSIAIGVDGLPVISYHDGTNFDLKVYACADSGCASGTAHVLDSEFAVGRYTSIVVRANGLPIISYQSSTMASLRAYDCTSADCSSGLVRFLDAGSVGVDSSIAIRADGRPIISYFDNKNWNLKIYDCTTVTCSSGSARTLTDGEGLVGTDTSIAIRLDGMPVVSYRDIDNAALKLYTCSATDCSSGSSRTLDAIGDVGRYSSIAIRADGRPVVSYFNNATKDLMMYSCSTVECSTGTRRILDSLPSPGWYTSIAIGVDGMPIISHYNNSGSEQSLRVFVCTDVNCMAGFSRELDAAPGVGAFTGIAIRNNGLPIVSYYDGSNGDLKVYGCADATCNRDRLFADGFEPANRGASRKPAPAGYPAQSIRLNDAFIQGAGLRGLHKRYARAILKFSVQESQRRRDANNVS
ncbi:hypothetical protein [Dokdonella sp.]|uniref:hypothetical protein n=1 Tax=Dokdonella sp. TaxID=2291710 RepID=UPI003C424B80